MAATATSPARVVDERLRWDDRFTRWSSCVRPIRAADAFHTPKSTTRITNPVLQDRLFRGQSIPHRRCDGADPIGHGGART